MQIVIWFRRPALHMWDLLQFARSKTNARQHKSLLYIKIPYILMQITYFFNMTNDFPCVGDVCGTDFNKAWIKKKEGGKYDLFFTPKKSFQHVLNHHICRSLVSLSDIRFIFFNALIHIRACLTSDLCCINVVAAMRGRHGVKALCLPAMIHCINRLTVFWKPAIPSVSGKGDM